MGKGRGVCSYTHTRSQCNHYANQHNPNNKAYRANLANQKVTQSKAKEEARKKYDWGILDGESYGWCDD